MANTRLQNFTPYCPVKINPQKISSELINIIDTYINDLIEEEKKETITNFKIHFKEQINKYFFWYIVSSNDFCMYQYTDRNEHNINRICGRSIKRKNVGNIFNEFLCAEHFRAHRKLYAKSIVLKGNETYCKAVNKDGSNCKYASRLSGLCTKHYKLSYGMDIVKIKQKIKMKKYKTYMENIDDQYIYNTGSENIDLFRYYYCNTNIYNIKIFDKIKKSDDQILNNFSNIKYICFYNDIKDKDKQKGANNKCSFYNNLKYKNISLNVRNTIDDISNKIYQLNNDIEKNNIILNNKNNDQHNTDVSKMTVRDCLNGGVKVINDKYYLKDISVYDIYNGKKININKLIKKYNEIKEMYDYIKLNNKYKCLKKYNNNKCFYIKENILETLIEYILLRSKQLRDNLYDFDKSNWLYIINNYMEDIEEALVDISNLDDKYKIYI